MYNFIEMFSCTYVDADECEEGISGCQHFCKNTNGSYNCSCQSGFRLMDRHMCEGEIMICIRDLQKLSLHTYVIN